MPSDVNQAVHRRFHSMHLLLRWGEKVNSSSLTRREPVGEGFVLSRQKCVDPVLTGFPGLTDSSAESCDQSKEHIHSSAFQGLIMKILHSHYWTGTQQYPQAWCHCSLLFSMCRSGFCVHKIRLFLFCFYWRTTIGNWSFRELYEIKFTETYCNTVWREKRTTVTICNKVK